MSHGACRTDERTDILRKARSAVARARVDKAVADARIGADAHAHFFNIRATALRDVCELVHEADFGREHGIGGVLGELRGAHVHDDEAVVIAREGFIERAHELLRARILGADDDTVRLHEVLDGHALFEEFGVRDDVELGAHAALGDPGLDLGAHLIRRAHRHGRFRDDDRIAVDMRAHGACGGEHIAQIGGAILIAARADGDDLEETVRDGLHRIGRELDTSGLAIALDQRLKARLMNRHIALIQTLDFFGVYVDAHDMVARLGKTCPCDQTDVAGAEYRNAHYFEGPEVKAGAPRSLEYGYAGLKGEVRRT